MQWLVGIEKLVETVEDYATLTQVLPRSATGQTLTVYTHMVNGLRREHENDGPDHVYIILVDNGRSRIYGADYAESLACIRCGACLNACPVVYQSTGGHAYGWSTLVRLTQWSHRFLSVQRMPNHSPTPAASVVPASRSARLILISRGCCLISVVISSGNAS